MAVLNRVDRARCWRCSGGRDACIIGLVGCVCKFFVDSCVVDLDVRVIGIVKIGWFYLNVFLKVCISSAERTRKGRVMGFDEWFDAFVVESVGAWGDEERLTDGYGE